MTRLRWMLACLCLCLWTVTATAATITVGPGKQYPSPAALPDSALAAGDIVAIDAGTYTGPAAVKVWTTQGLTIRGVGGQAIMEAQGASVAGKAIWLIQGHDYTVEFVTFLGATVPDGNGAGIKDEGRGLTLRHCRFLRNQNAILTRNEGATRTSDVRIEHSEFGYNGTRTGFTHNVYIGEIRSLIFRYNWSYNSLGGQLLKSRAATNLIEYNRLADTPGAGSNYEVDISNGGQLTFVGNLVRQDAQTTNSTLLSYAPEGAVAGNTVHTALIAYNTFLNDRFAGSFVRYTGTPALTMVNNIFVGAGDVVSTGGTILPMPAGNVRHLKAAEAQFFDLSNQNWHLTSTSPAKEAGHQGGLAPPPFQYRHPMAALPRPVLDGLPDAGAYEAAAPDSSPVTFHPLAVGGRILPTNRAQVVWSPLLVDTAVPTYTLLKDGAPHQQGLTGLSFTEPLAPGVSTQYTVIPVVAGVASPFRDSTTLTVTRASRTLTDQVGWTELLESSYYPVCPVGVPGTTGCQSITAAFNSASYDPGRNRILLWGGGHRDWFGNELYSVEMATTPLVTRLTDPGTPYSTYTTCQETNANGTQPNSRHTFDGVAYLASHDHFFAFGGALACANADTSQTTWLFDFQTMTWRDAKPLGPIPAKVEGAMVAYDPVSGSIFVHDRRCLYRYDFPSNTYSKGACNTKQLNYLDTSIIDPVRRLFLIFGGTDTQWYHLDNMTWGTYTSTGGQAIVGGYYPGLAYDAKADRVIGYLGGDTMYTLDVAAKVWTPTTYPGGPPLVLDGGRAIFKKITYIPAHDLFAVVREGNIFTLRTRPVGPVGPVLFDGALHLNLEDR